MQLRWEPIARALADALGFDYGAWETEGDLRRVGFSQDPFGRVSPVLLILTPGHLGDYQELFRELSTRTESTELFPTHRWFTKELEALRTQNRLEFVDLTQRLAQIEAQPTARIPLPTITKVRGTHEPKVRAVIHAGNGLTWSQITIEITGGQTIQFKARPERQLLVFQAHPARPGIPDRHPNGSRTVLADV